VFTKPDGTAYHPQWLTKRFERLSFGAGVPPIRLHDTRHGAACLAHAAGASMKAIQALLRHASYSITADTYTTVFAELGDALAEDIASVVPRQRPVGDSSETAGLTTVSHLRKNR
jgi:integrase